MIPAAPARKASLSASPGSGKAVGLPRTATELVAALLQPHWKRYRKALRRCQDKFSPGAIHDFRVESRRLLSSLELLGPQLPDRRVQKAQRLLKRHLDLFDDLRDTQVQLQTLAGMRRPLPVPQPFKAALLKREQRSVRRTRKNIRKVRTRRLGKLMLECQGDAQARLQDATPRKALALLLRSVARAFRRTRRLRKRVAPRDTEAIHYTRVAFKKFRYMVEALAPCLPAVTAERLAAMRHYQTLMGNIQDAAVLLATLDEFLRRQDIGPGAVRRFRAPLLRRRRRLIRAYLRSADQLLQFWPLPKKTAGTSPKPTLNQSMPQPDRL